MLEGLDSLPWSELRHACGPANDVPQLIRGLLEPDEDLREEAILVLFETIWHQGSVYEASAYAVPFLQELLRSDETPDKLPIAQLLAELANGASYIDGAAQTEEMENLVRESLAREGRDFEKERAKSRRYVEETRTAVGQELPLLYPFLSCEIPEIRRAAAAALQHYPARRLETLPLLQTAAASEDDPEAMEAVEQSIAALESAGP